MIQAGDVLLTHGNGAVSWAIRFLDRSEVNHAAIALDGDMQAEAVWTGLRRSPISQLIDSNQYVLVRRPNPKLTDPAPVVQAANAMIDERVPYAYQQLLLLAVLCATRTVPIPRLARKLVRSALDGAADALNNKLDADGSKLMICSEFVYRCFSQAAPPTHIEVGSDASPAGVEGGYVFVDAFASEHPDLVALAADGGAVAADAGAPDMATIEARIEAAAAQYAAAVAADPAVEDAEAAEVAAAHPAGAIAAGVDEPSDADIARALVRFSGALEQSQQSNRAAPAGVVTDVGFGALKGILDTRTNPNFVTPGDLFRSHSLTAVDKLPA